MHALIIEDEPMIAALIAEMLRELGWTSVDFAATQDDAVARARRRPPDLITSDVRLSEGCGIAAVQTIRSGGSVPVVFVTATGWEVRERIGDAPVVLKPFTSADLARALATIRQATWEPGNSPPTST